MPSKVTAYCRLASRRLTLLCVLVFALVLLVSSMFSYDYFRQWYSSGAFIRHRFRAISDIDTSSGSLPQDYNAVILYLGSVRRSRELVLSLSYVFANVPLHSWPIIIFHAGEFNDVSTQRKFKFLLYNYIRSGDIRRTYMFVERIEFIQLEWTFPPGISHSIEEIQPLYDWAWPGYNHMIKFYLYDIMHHPRLNDVTYYLRLDTDSYIYAPLCYDPLERMHAHNLTYAYRIQNIEHPDYVQGLEDLVDDYAHKHSDIAHMMKQNHWTLPPRGERVGKDFPQYYNNFEIVRLDAFRKPDVQAWLDEIMSEPERIYKWRWGDAPLRFATVNMFFDVASEVEEFCAIPYWHFGYHGQKCSCSPT